MRVLFVNTNQSPVYGGMERWMIDAAAGLASRGHATVLLGRPDAAWLGAARRAGVRVRGEIHGTWAQRALRIGRIMRAERADIVIAKAKKAARMAAFGRATGARARVILFLGATHEMSGRRWLDRFTWRHVDAGMVVAHGAARWYGDEGFGPAAKMHVLWKGVDLAAFDAACGDRAATRRALGLAPETLAVGTVGRLAWQKGLDTFFDAVRRVRTRVPDARFFVVGGGRDAPSVAAAAAAPELGGSITLLGQRDDAPALLAALDVVVQSSRREAMAQTTLEGMAAGRPVVSTTTCGADEAIADGVSGLLVPVGDAEALAERIVLLAADPARRSVLGKAARKRIESEFTRDRMLERCEAIFGAIAGGSTRARP